uniref:Lipoprotein n=1 Tax=Gracilinema caldarium TaxID=215591 RepID=A0A7C3E3E6_9SPIR
MIRILIIALVGLLSFSSCSSKEVQSVDRQNLFRLDIGRLENQIDLFGLDQSPAMLKTHIAMRDGIFYISDSKGQKVSKFTSYGDLLSMIYNQETNPPPFTLKKDSKSTEIVTRRAVSYPLIQNGNITVDSRKHLYVEDRLPPDRRTYDAEKRVLFDSTVLHFDSDGNFIEYLGQEGIGGTPFPYINNLYTSIHDELAVVCRLPTGWNVYWFDANGAMLYVVLIRNEDLPVPKGETLYPSLDSISVAPDSRHLIIKIDYYKDSFDESTKTKSGIVFDRSILWVMNVEDGAYLNSVEIPPFDQIQSNQKEKVQLVYSVLGVSRGGKVFLSIPDTNGYHLLVLDLESRDQKRGFIQVDPDELAFNTFYLSEEGILSALLATDYEAKVVWWRTEKFTGDVRK